MESWWNWLMGISNLTTNSQSSEQDVSLQDKFGNAIESDNLESFKQLFTQSSGSWRQIRINGQTLLQETILQKRVSIFKYLLKFSDVEYLETLNHDGQTAITVAATKKPLRSIYPNFVIPLVEKYDKIPSHYGRDLLHYPIKSGSFETTEYLLKRGLDPNRRDRTHEDFAALHIALQSVNIKSKEIYKFVAMLLLNGADPFLKFRKWNCFEMAVKHRGPEIQQLLFDYTFDRLETYRIDFMVLLKLATSNKVLFDRILKYDVEFIVHSGPGMVNNDNLDYLFELQDTECLNIVLTEFYPAVCESFQDYSSGCSYLSFRGFIDNILFPEFFMKNLDLFLESGDFVRNEIVDLMARTPPEDIFEIVFEDTESTLTESDVMLLITFMCVNGLQITTKFFDLVYARYGYCDLFKFLIQMDFERSQRSTEGTSW